MSYEDGPFARQRASARARSRFTPVGESPQAAARAARLPMMTSRTMCRVGVMTALPLVARAGHRAQIWTMSNSPSHGPIPTGASQVAQAYDRWALRYDDDRNLTRDLDADVLRAAPLRLAG